MKTAIHSNQFVIVSVSTYGSFSMAQMPKIHTNYQSAISEAQRLAGLNPGFKFVVLAVAAVAQLRNTPVKVDYSL